MTKRVVRKWSPSSRSIVIGWCGLLVILLSICIGGSVSVLTGDSTWVNVPLAALGAWFTVVIAAVVATEITHARADRNNIPT